MKDKIFVKIDKNDAWNNPVTVYTSPEGGFMVRLPRLENGGYGFAKIKTKSGPGRDQALNISYEDNIIMGAIYDDIRGVMKEFPAPQE